MLLCNEKKMNISNDDIDYTNNNFVLHMYLYIFV